MENPRVCPRCRSTDVGRDNRVLEDGAVGKVVFNKTTCGTCGFYVCNIAWDSGNELMYRGWTSNGSVPDDAPKAVWEVL